MESQPFFLPGGEQRRKGSDSEWRKAHQRKELTHCQMVSGLERPELQGLRGLPVKVWLLLHRGELGGFDITSFISRFFGSFLRIGQNKSCEESAADLSTHLLGPCLPESDE
jgi:hypothetical protein